MNIIFHSKDKKSSSLGQHFFFQILFGFCVKVLGSRLSFCIFLFSGIKTLTSLAKPPTTVSTNTPATNETKQKPEVQAFNCNETNAYCKPNFGLPDVPRENISSSTTYIDLRNNSINSLNQNSFSGLSNVTTILLSNNNISEISSHTFQDQANLTYLDLGFNQIKSVDGDM